MRNKLKRLSSLLLVILVMVCIATPVLALVYSADLTVEETSGNAYTMLPLMTNFDTEFASTHDYITASGLDTRILRGTTALPHMLADDKILFATSISADSTQVLEFTTDNSLLTSFDIITGYDGYITVADNNTLELGDNFTILLDAYIDTTQTTGVLFSKPHAIKCTSNETGNITVAITTTAYGGAFPTVTAVTGGSTVVATTSHTLNLTAGIEPNFMLLSIMSVNTTSAITFPNGWTQLFDETNTNRVAAYYRIADGSEGSDITVTTSTEVTSAYTTYLFSNISPEIEATTSTFTASNHPNPPDLIPSWGNHNNLWIAVAGCSPTRGVNSYPAGYGNSRLDTNALGAGGAMVATARKEAAAASDNPGQYTLSNTSTGIAATIAVAPNDLYIVVKASGVASGGSTVNVTGNVTHLAISIDGVLEDDTLLTANVTDNANDWVLFQNNVIPYADYFIVTINGTQELWFQPNDIISGTDLPDRSAGNHDGVITWGTNPVGVSLALAPLVYVPTTTGVTELTTPDVIGVINPPQEMFPEESEMEGTNIWLYPVLHGLAQDTNTPIYYFWYLGCLIWVLGLMVTTMKWTQNTFLALVAVMFGLASSVAAVLMPPWVMFIAAIFILIPVVMERSSGF